LECFFQQAQGIAHGVLTDIHLMREGEFDQPITAQISAAANQITDTGSD
jgi:hypothetical protein